MRLSRVLPLVAVALVACDDPVRPNAATRPPTDGGLPARTYTVTTGTVTDLGTLSGGTQSWAWDINNAGAIVGFSATNGTGARRATLWAAGTHTITNLGVIPGGNGNASTAYDIDDAGNIAGVSRVNTGSQVDRAFYRPASTGVMGNLGVPSGMTTSLGRGHNGTGVVGTADSAGVVNRAFYVEPGGSFVSLASHGGVNNSLAYKVNASGLIVGYASSSSGVRATTWTAATASSPVALPHPTNGTAGWAWNVNDSGIVVGYENVSGVRKAVRWDTRVSPATVTVLAEPASDTAGEAWGINKAGVIVGYTTGSSGDRATVWAPGGAGVHLPLLSGATESRAYAINDSGQIVGYSVVSGVERATLWTVTISNPPTAVAGGPYTVKEGGRLFLDGRASSDPSGENLTYEWDFGDGSELSNVARPSHYYADNGTYDAVLVVTNESGASDTSVAVVTVTNRPPVPFAYTAPEQTDADTAVILSGDSLRVIATFSDYGTADDPWRWSVTWSTTDVDSGVYATYGAGVTRARRFTTAKTYLVRYRVTDKDGGTGLQKIYVRVNRRPISIDVEPGDSTNTLSLGDTAAVRVAILSRAGFNPNTVLQGTVRISDDDAPGVPPLAGSTYQDLNGDSVPDRIFRFRRSDMVAAGALTGTSGQLVVRGTVSDGRQFVGVQAVFVTP